jgi:hypothetical protein
MNIILLFYAPASTILGIKCLNYHIVQWIAIIFFKQYTKISFTEKKMKKYLSINSFLLLYISFTSLTIISTYFDWYLKCTTPSYQMSSGRHAFQTCICSLIGFNSYFVLYLMCCFGNNPLYMELFFSKFGFRASRWKKNKAKTEIIRYKYHTTEQNRTEFLLVWNPYTKDCYQNNTLNTKQSNY